MGMGLVKAQLPVSQYETLRLPTSPRYLCSIWCEVQAECPPRTDAKKSSLQAVCWPAHGTSMATAIQSSSLAILQLSPQTPPAQPQPMALRYPGIQSDPAPPWLL